MYSENRGPIINSRHHGKMPDAGKSRAMKLIAFFAILLAVVFYYFLLQPLEDYKNELIQEENAFSDTSLNDLPPLDLPEEDLEALKEKLEKNMAEEVEGDARFYYDRALKKEKQKDFEGAVIDYEKTIVLAKKHSEEMWAALNNRGVIRAKQFKDYKGAMDDFTRIIEIETNRPDGKINTTRLESGYTNRAYVRKMKGDRDGACDDLYEALWLGKESSESFIRKQINRNCQ